jgi:3-deoxy-manno-octulosonate cytidylyltransferase (CMP-KDO synthetase)
VVSTTDVLIVIPARYASSRFPGKPLACIGDKPMIQHVWQQAMAVGYPVVVATDDERIATVVKAFGGQVCMTQADHPSGTDRVWEVAQQYPSAQWILNLQGDEPFVEAEAHLAPLLQAAMAQPGSNTPSGDIWTLVTPFRVTPFRVTPFTDNASSANNLGHPVEDPNRVKVARAASGQALYFSRSVIPYHRQAATADVPQAAVQYWHHMGVYLYQRHALAAMVTQPVSLLEGIEQLEQLRALEMGMRIQTVAVNYSGFGIDTPADLATANDQWQALSQSR